ncbi:LysR family transcriptional regulator [Isosphaeraceae bacterium EP7]
MQLEALKIFCDVVRWASFSRGAAENSVSQSCASQTVHQLEDRLGVKLIDRSKRPLVPTPQGKVYYEGCKDLVGRYLEIEGRAKAAATDAGNVVGTVRVASIYSVGLNHMSQYSSKFERQHPGASVRVEYLHPRRVVESVIDESAELGLISYPRKWPELRAIPWREEAMVLAVHPTHRFAGRASVGVAELDGERFVGFDADLSIRRAIDKFLRAHGIHVQVALEFDNIENIKRAVEIPAGVAILPEPTLARELAAGTLCSVPFADAKLTRPLAVLHRRGQTLGPTAARFLALLTADEGGADAHATTAGATATTAAATAVSKPAEGHVPLAQ